MTMDKKKNDKPNNARVRVQHGSNQMEPFSQVKQQHSQRKDHIPLLPMLGTEQGRTVSRLTPL